MCDNQTAIYNDWFHDDHCFIFASFGWLYKIFYFAVFPVQRTKNKKTQEKKTASDKIKCHSGTQTQTQTDLSVNFLV